jgi:ketosteroid isomerase-like protein
MTRKRVVERYIEGFRTGDHELILSCLTDDVSWSMPPYFERSGRAAFDDAIENEASPGLPKIQLTRLIEEGDVVVAEGAVQAALRDGGRIDAVLRRVPLPRRQDLSAARTWEPALIESAPAPVRA